MEEQQGEEPVYLDTYLRILPEDLNPERIVRDGYKVYLEVDLGTCSVLVRRIRAYGAVTGLSRTEWRIDFSLLYGDAEIPVRAWQEYFDVVENLTEGVKAEVLGLIREGGGSLYILPLIVREKDIPNWEELVTADRAYLASIVCREK